MAYRDPRFNNRMGIGKHDEVLLQADNEATCWFAVKRNDCINITAHPAEMVSSTDCDMRFPKAPIPSCEAPALITQTAICPLDTKIVGTDACLILERKMGGQRDDCATEVRRWELDAAPVVDDIAQYIDEMVKGRDGFMRLRLAAKGANDVFVRFQVTRHDRAPVGCC